MKKILLLLFVLCLSPSLCLAGSQIACEPETPTSASFSVSDRYNVSFISFVNYAESNGFSEYWVRFTLFRDNNKILYNASLDIDGTVYDLQPVYEPSHKYEYAAYSHINHDIGITLSGQQPFRYYTIPDNVVEKLKKAQKVTFIYNEIDKLGIHQRLYDDYIRDMKTIINLKYSDLPTYFHPPQAN